MCYVFYEVVSVRSFEEVLDFMLLLTKFPFSFLRRNKRAPLGFIQCLLDFLKLVENPLHRVRVDEDGSLAQRYEFNVLLIHNKVLYRNYCRECV